MSGVPDEDSSVGLQAPPSHRDGDRRLRATPRIAGAATPDGDGPGAGHPAPVPARRHAVAQPDRHGRSGQRFDLAALPGELGRDGAAGEGPRPAGRHAARPPRPDPRQLLGARQARRRSHRPQPDGPRQAGHQIPHCDHGDGVPVACAATAANVNDTLAFERLFLAAFAVMARIRTVFADKGYDAEHHRDLCRRFGAEPRIHKRGRPRGSGLGQALRAALRRFRSLAGHPELPRPRWPGRLASPHRAPAELLPVHGQRLQDLRARPIPARRGGWPAGRGRAAGHRRQRAQFRQPGVPGTSPARPRRAWCWKR